VVDNLKSWEYKYDIFIYFATAVCKKGKNIITPINPEQIIFEFGILYVIVRFLEV
jgi:hypothetical protein